MSPLFRRGAKPAAAAAGPPGLDKLAGDPDARRFARELARGQWQEFHEFLAGVTDWATRHWYLHQLSDITGRPEWLDEWVAARPDSAIPVLFRGCHGKHWAWQARGTGLAGTVRPDAWPLFHSRLVAADQDFTRAAALDPKDPCPWEMSLPVVRGLSLGQDEARRRFEEAHRRDPWNLFGCVDMIQVTAQKWGGSHEAMFEFARSASAGVAEGSSVHRVIPHAHVEKWTSLYNARAVQEAYFREPKVRSEIEAAAARSIGSPHYGGGLLSWADRSAFAFCFHQMGAVAAAREQLTIIGPRITAPWTLYRDPMAQVRRARGEAR
ncbi:MAG TPA: hypothetical protein VMU95_35645 [Trebonia sp.]|nr:hypothetical protein [Trebonia sp.]